jgi:hypothetical protein
MTGLLFGRKNPYPQSMVEQTIKRISHRHPFVIL